MIVAIDHIGIAVRDLDQSINLYSSIFQVSSFHRETIPDQGVHVASFSLNGVRIELTAPTSDDSPLARFLERRGEGIHHIAFLSDAITGDMQNLSAIGIELINKTPVDGAHNMNIAFLHPKSTGGVLMELCSPRIPAS